MEVIINKYCTGINNKVDPVRIKYNPETGVADLAEGTDILIDSAGGISSIRGTVLAIAGNFISSFPCNKSSFYVLRNRTTDSDLNKAVISSNGLTITLYSLRSSLTRNARMDWQELDGIVYYMNGYEYGRIINENQSVNWPTSIHPRGDVNAVRVQPGNHFDFHSGRCVISYGKEIRWTEPGLWGIILEDQSWRRLPSKVLMIASVGTGCYISDEDYIYWCEGLDPNKWIPKIVLNYPALEFCRFPGFTDPSHHGFESTIPAVLFGTSKGPVIGLANGQAINLIDKKVLMRSDLKSGAIMVVDETIIIQSSEV